MGKQKAMDQRPATAEGRGPQVDSPRSALRENFESIIVAVLFALFVRGFIAQPYKIPSGSMEENLLIGDHLVVNKVLYGAGADEFGPAFLPTKAVARGDIIIFRPPHEPETDYIKRVIGLPGETLQLRYNPRRNGVSVVIDGELLPEGFRLVREGPVEAPADSRWTVNFTRAPPEIMNRGWRDRTIQLKAGEYFVMGDNRNDSQDSRFWGTVEAERIRGKAWLIYWSYDGGGEEPQGGFFRRVGYYGRIAIGFIGNSRWSRTCRRIR